MGRLSVKKKQGHPLFVTNAVTAAILGGTVSALTGGKFANGAVTAAFQFMFNCAAHDCIKAEEQRLLIKQHLENVLRGIHHDFSQLAIDMHYFPVEEIMHRLTSWGVSGEVSIILPIISDGGGTIGVNVQYIEGHGFGIFFYTPSQDISASGMSLGANFLFNEARGNGEWSGTFNNIEAGLGPLAVGHFQSPDNAWIGNAIGVSFAKVPALSKHSTEYTKYWGHSELE